MEISENGIKDGNKITQESNTLIQRNLQPLKTLENNSQVVKSFSFNFFQFFHFFLTKDLQLSARWKKKYIFTPENIKNRYEFNEPKKYKVNPTKKSEQMRKTGYQR